MYVHVCMMYVQHTCCMYAHIHTCILLHVVVTTVEPGEKRTHLDRPPDLKISPIFVLRPFMKSFRCELCAWGTLNMSGDVEKNAVFFWYVKVIEFCPFLVVYRFSGPVLCHKNIKAAPFLNAMGVVGAGRLLNLSRQLKVMNGPHAVLVVDGPDHRPETGRTHFPA